MISLTLEECKRIGHVMNNSPQKWLSTQINQKTVSSWPTQALQRGQFEWDRSHVSMHETWKPWVQLRRSLSHSPKQMAQSALTGICSPSTSSLLNSHWKRNYHTGLKVTASKIHRILIRNCFLSQLPFLPPEFERLSLDKKRTRFFHSLSIMNNIHTAKNIPASLAAKPKDILIRRN